MKKQLTRKSFEMQQVGTVTETVQQRNYQNGFVEPAQIYTPPSSTVEIENSNQMRLSLLRKNPNFKVCCCRAEVLFCNKNCKNKYRINVLKLPKINFQRQKTLRKIESSYVNISPSFRI